MYRQIYSVERVDNGFIISTVEGDRENVSVFEFVCDGSCSCEENELKVFQNVLYDLIEFFGIGLTCCESKQGIEVVITSNNDPPVEEIIKDLKAKLAGYGADMKFDDGVEDDIIKNIEEDSI